MKTLLYSAKTFLVISLLFSGVLIAESKLKDNTLIIKNCNDILLACLIQDGNNKNQCFLSASNLSQCKNSNLGVLSLKRWEASPDKGNIKDNKSNYKASINSNFILNHNCLSEFDNSLIAILLSGIKEIEINSNPFIKLNSCKLKLSNRYNSN